MQQPVGQTWNEGHRFQMGGTGTTGPPAGDGPETGYVKLKRRKAVVSVYLIYVCADCVKTV